MSHLDVWQRNVLGRGIGESKGPQVGMSMAGSRNIREAIMAQGDEETGDIGKGQADNWGQVRETLLGTKKTLALTQSEMGAKF